MCNVECVVYSVLFTVYSVHCTVCNVQCVVYNAKYTVRAVLNTVQCNAVYCSSYCPLSSVWCAAVSAVAST